MRNLILGFMLVTPFVTQAAEKQLLWGDTHLHTSYSFDAYINNNFTSDPHNAYRYAKGQPVIHPYFKGRVQIGTPLDFLVVSDHAEFLGTIRHINQQGLITDEIGWWDSIKAHYAAWVLNRALAKRNAVQLFRDILPPPGEVREAAADTTIGGNTQILPPMMMVQVDTWRSITEIADQYNDPGNFTAFIGWEWSSIPGGANLHRVVITNGDASSAQTYQPYSLLKSQYPEDLWAWLEEVSVSAKADFLAIPHNSNLSKGFMFDTNRLRGTDFDSDYIAARRKWEPIVEVTQIKGDSETHPELSPDDEFADFEEFPYYLQVNYSPYVVKPGDFMRSALKRGLALEEQYGQNPYQFGVIGSTDAHTGLASAEEDNFWGKMATDSIPENKISRWAADEPAPYGWAFSAQGLAAVWSEENTRESIMEAMRRKEVYATTGPRIRLQFYGSADFAEVDIESAELYAQATGAGVPMGGELNALTAAPSFLVLADKDPVGANLDRIQIVKGWLDGNGDQREKVYDVSWSGDRQVGANGKVPAVGNTVDLSSARFDNSIGEARLTANWRDPDFDPAQSAFYYVRVLQIPTPRHSLYDAIALGGEYTPEQPNTIQERAYSSAIWYTP